MMKKYGLAALLAVFGVAGLSACGENDEPIEENVEEMGDEAEEFGEDTEDAIDDMGDELDDEH